MAEPICSAKRIVGAVPPGGAVSTNRLRRQALAWDRYVLACAGSYPTSRGCSYQWVAPGCESPREPGLNRTLDKLLARTRRWPWRP